MPTKTLDGCREVLAELEADARDCEESWADARDADGRFPATPATDAELTACDELFRDA